ncbi:MAG: hypothetical protein WBA12_01430, partial [Catalinimonas sp.]
PTTWPAGGRSSVRSTTWTRPSARMHLEGYDHGEIGEVVGITPNYVAHYLSTVERMMRFERRQFVAMLPVLIVIGGLTGAVLKTDPTVWATATDGRLWLYLLGLSVLLVPAGWWLGNWMNRYAFGPYLAQLHKYRGAFDDERNE